MAQYCRLIYAERKRIEQLKNEGHGVRDIARIINRSPSTVSCELRRRFTKYNADTAHKDAQKNQINAKIMHLNWIKIVMGLVANSGITSPFDTFCVNPWLNISTINANFQEQNVGNSVIDYSIPGNRLREGENGLIEIIPKSLGEVVGERLFKPLIDQTCSLSNWVFSLFRETCSIDDAPNSKKVSQQLESINHAQFESKKLPKNSLKKLNTLVNNEIVDTNHVNVIVAAGPGGSAFDHTLIDKISTTLQTAEGQTVKSSISIGNGEIDISFNSIIDAVKIAKEESRPISLFLQSHGRNKYGEHEILLRDDEWSSSRELFRKLKSTLGDKYPLSIFMTSCHGGAAAQAAIDELPTGSVFVALSRSSEVVSGFDIERFASSVDQLPWSSSEKLLYHYLTKSLKNRITPVVAYASEKTLDLGQLFVAQVGKSFTAKQQARAHHQIDGLIGKENVDVLINKIQNARSECDIYAVDYGPALAVVFAGQEKSTSDSS